MRLVFVLCWLFLFYIVSTPFLFNAVAYSWERQFDAFDLLALPEMTKAKIVVLGAGCSHDAALPKTALLGGSALPRIVESVRIANVYPNASIYTSGYSASGKTPGALYLKDAAIELGISPKRIFLQPEPHNTRAEADVFFDKHYQMSDTVILVTSAIHIPRARKHFINAGVKNLHLAPSDYLTFSENEYAWHNFIPSVSYWFKIERLIKEFVGYHLVL